MSTRDKLYKLARKVGVKQFDASYNRSTKQWTVYSVERNPDGPGYVSYGIGVYLDYAHAKRQLADDWQAYQQGTQDPAEDTFFDDMREASDAYIASRLSEQVTLLYDIVTQSLDDTSDGQAVLYALLDTLRGVSEHPVVDAAQSYLDSVESVETHNVTKPAATGRYTSKLPDAPKAPIAWEQPAARQAPVYTFEVDCPYCQRSETLSRHSPRPPAHCGRDECQQQHQRKLARERKRRQRAREKQTV